MSLKIFRIENKDPLLNLQNEKETFCPPEYSMDDAKTTVKRLMLLMKMTNQLTKLSLFLSFSRSPSTLPNRRKIHSLTHSLTR